MKTLKDLIIIVLLISTALCSCTYYDQDSFKFKNFKFDEVKFKTISDLEWWIIDNIEYIPDIKEGYLNYWQSPFTTDKIKKGDCEDMSLLFMAILYYQFHIKSKLQIVILPNGEGHAQVVLSDGSTYLRAKNQENKGETNYIVTDELTFSQIEYKFAGGL